MSKKKSSGGRIVAFILAGIVVVAGLVVAGYLWISNHARKEAGASAVVAVEEKEANRRPARLDFDASDLESLEPLAEGDPVPLRHFLLVMEDPRSTELARETFRKQADGAPATWHLIFQTVGEANGVLVADLLSRYAFRIEGGLSGSALMVRAAFDESQRGALMRLRREDGVILSGTLDLSGDEVLIADARVVAPE